MSEDAEYRTFSEFCPFRLSEHGNRTSRRPHTRQLHVGVEPPTLLGDADPELAFGFPSGNLHVRMGVDVRVDAYRGARGHMLRGSDTRQRQQFVVRFYVETDHASQQCCGSLSALLPTSENEMCAAGMPVQKALQLAARYDVRADTGFVHQLQDREIAIRLDGKTQTCIESVQRTVRSLMRQRIAVAECS